MSDQHANQAPANTVISSRIEYPGKIVTLRVEQILQSDGQPGVREIVDHMPAVVIIAWLEASDEIIFIEQYRDAIKSSLTELPAGILNDNESPEDTARRELLEETGYEAGALQHIGTYYTSPGFTNEQHHLFLATQLRKVSGIQDTTEIYALKLIPRQKALNMAITGQFADGKTMLGLLWIAHDPQFSSAVQSRSAPAT